MKKTVLLVFGIFSLAALNGQKSQTIDSAWFQVLYSLEYRKDLVRPELIGQDEMLVLVGDSITSFYSYLNFVYDSTRSANPDRHRSSVTLSGNMSMATPAKTDLRATLNDVSYFFDKRTDVLSCRCRMLPRLDKYGYSEQYTKPEWKISGDTESVLGRLCQKATSE